MDRRDSLTEFIVLFSSNVCVFGMVFEFKHILLLLAYKYTSKRVGPQVLPTLVTALPEDGINSCSILEL